MKMPKVESMDFEDRRYTETTVSHVRVFLVASSAHVVSQIQTFDLEKWHQQLHLEMSFNPFTIQICNHTFFFPLELMKINSDDLKVRSSGQYPFRFSRYIGCLSGN